jgi:hypothetical protein
MWASQVARRKIKPNTEGLFLCRRLPHLISPLQNMPFNMTARTGVTVLGAVGVGGFAVYQMMRPRDRKILIVSGPPG